MQRTVNVVGLQLDLEVDPDVGTMLTKIRRAACGADVVVLPELLEMSYCETAMESLGSNIRRQELIAGLSEIADQCRVSVIAGFARKTERGWINAAMILMPDIVPRFIAEKRCLYAGAGESQYFMKGQRSTPISIGRHSLGVIICNDLRAPEIASDLCQQGADMLVVIAAWPYPRIAHWKSLLRARAIENGVYVVGVNRVGQNSQFSFAGSTVALDPRGLVHQECSADTPGMARIRLDDCVHEEARRWIIPQRHRRLLAGGQSAVI